jgi:site-specific DNA-methyltransferase (adenine-specific)
MAFDSQREARKCAAWLKYATLRGFRIVSQARSVEFLCTIAALSSTNRPRFLEMDMADGSAWPEIGRVVEDQTIIGGDCLDVLASRFAHDEFDVVVTSPPYNLKLSYNVYDDTKSERDYLEWLMSVAEQIHRVLKADGSFFLNISGSNSQPWLPFELVVKLRGLGFCLQNHITWIKSISTNLVSTGHFKPISGKRFMHHNHEHIFHLTKTNKVELDRLSIGIPFQDKSNIARRGHERDLRCRGNTWFIPYSTVKSKAQKFNHPGTFPVELPLWCIYLHGKTSPRVLDPFMGTGTTLVAARMALASGTGIDIDPAYVDTACERVQSTANGAIDIALNAGEVMDFLKQDPRTEKDGGWQSLLLGLQKRLNKTTGHLTLTSADLEQIQRYAFHCTRGGWQNRLRGIFGRSLGPGLDGRIKAECGTS